MHARVRLSSKVALLGKPDANDIAYIYICDVKMECYMYLLQVYWPHGVGRHWDYSTVLPFGHEADGLQSHGHHHRTYGAAAARLQKGHEGEEGQLGSISLYERCWILSIKAF